MRRMKRLIPALFILLGCIPSHPKQRMAEPVAQKQVLQTADPITKATGSENVIEYEGFTISYNSQWLIPNWVAYELTAEETDGPYSRKGRVFMADPSIGVIQADDQDYRGSGWSRGHMAPAADFKWSDTAMKESFYYTNICPQDVQLNNRYWNKLENMVRLWAQIYGRVFVVTGPIIGENIHGTIGKHQVVVPDAFYKAILAIDGKNYKSIAFIMVNTPEPRHLRDCAVSVNRLEEIIGVDLFAHLNDSIEEAVESKVDITTWNIR